MPTVPMIVADFTTQLSAAIALAGTTGTLASYNDDDGVALPTGTYYFTIDGNNSNKEHIKCTLTAGVMSAIYSVSRQGVETSGAARAHRIGALVVMTDFATYKSYIDNTALQGAANASTTVAGVTRLSAAPTDPATPIAVGTNDSKLPTADPTTLFAPIATPPPGVISPYAGRSAPTGYLLCDGTAVSRATYATLFAIICPSQSYTATSATPTVVTATAHGLVVGDKIHFTTAVGGRGITAGSDYYVISAGLTADAFEFALTPGGAAINTTGTESGTLYKSAYGAGDGSTTFNVPDLRSRSIVGRSASAPTTTLTFVGTQRSSNVITILDTVFPSQGQAVVLSTTGALPTGLSPGTYYIIRVSSTTISFATTQANANTATAVSLSGDGSGVNTITFTNRAHTVLGRNGGEEFHAQSKAELPTVADHNHGVNMTSSSGSGISGFDKSTPWGNNKATLDSSASLATSAAAGGFGSDSLHNNMSPFAIVNYIIKT